MQQIVEEGRTPYVSAWGGLKVRDQKAVERAIELTSIGSLRHRIYNELKGGERQREDYARAGAGAETPAAGRADANLDFGRLMELMALIRMLHREGIDILAAVHDLALIPDTFASVILINRDELLLVGSPEHILCRDILD